ncbi:MAG: hypothetical protein ACO3CX_00840 [Ilumatobacteraceae bacterium]|jgi:hypothetical protein
MSEQTFVDAVLAGLASPDQVDDWIERWHTTDTGDIELHDFLGLDETEMESWLQSGETLEQIIARRDKRA